MELVAVSPDEPQPRFSSMQEKMAIRNKVAKLRLEGKTFDEIGQTVSMSERHVRRLYHEFLYFNNQDHAERRNLLFGQLVHNMEYSIELANRQLAKELEKNDPKMILLWQKIRQESVKDYYQFLKDLGLSYSWVTQDFSKPFLSPERHGQPWPEED